MRASEALRAPAKINLTLEVLGRRPDGLHGVRSVMVPIDLTDELHIERADDGLGFACDVPELQDENLVTRAFHALALPRGYKITLRKTIPTGAGLGGGSSDAAAVLLAAQRGLFGPTPSIDFVSAARSLGSDVPFFLVETAALVEGTGERVTALGPVPPWHAVIVKPPVHVSTAWAYEQIDAAARSTRPRNDSVSLQMGEAIQRADFERAVALLHNDFHTVIAGKPEIRRALDILANAGAGPAMLTGSGACVFAIAADAAQAAAIAGRAELPEGYRLYTAAFWNGQQWRRAA